MLKLMLKNNIYKNKIIILLMTPIENIHNNLADSINEYINIVFKNGFIYGFITGSLVTIILLRK